MNGDRYRIRAHESKEIREWGAEEDVKDDVSQETDTAAVEPLSDELKAFVDDYQDELLEACFCAGMRVNCYSI